MKVPEDEEERPLAWKAILEDTPILARDGSELGTIVEVLGAEQQDVFHGIVVGLRGARKDVIIPADQVSSISNRRIVTALTIEQAEALDPYHPEASYQLGITGLLGRLGWVDERDKRV